VVQFKSSKWMLSIDIEYKDILNGLHHFLGYQYYRGCVNSALTETVQLRTGTPHLTVALI
jgi:hypothetical protein